MVDLENFELSQDQRTILGLRIIQPDWKALIKTPLLTPNFFLEEVSEKISIYYDNDFIIKKAIYNSIGMPGSYYECDIDTYINLTDNTFNHCNFFYECDDEDDDFGDFNYQSFALFCHLSCQTHYYIRFETRTIYYGRSITGGGIRCKYDIPKDVSDLEDMGNFLRKNIKTSNYSKSNF